MADVEIFTDIEEYDGYAVSNHGVIKSKERFVKVFRHGKYHDRYTKEKILKLRIDKDGYYRINLRKDGKKTAKFLLVSRLVAKAFLPNPNNFPVVNHKDENKLNNYVCINEDGSVDYEKSNLEWCTVGYNSNYGTCQERRVKKLKKPIIQCTLDGEEFCYWFSESDASKETHIQTSSICQCAKGKLPQAGGFIWKYAS